MGSKDKICDELIKLFPKAKHFYDLFGGGFSVTHAMLLRRRRDYERFYFNEPRPGITNLIRDAIDGKYSYDNFKPPWVSREEFFAKVDNDPYINICWSFGNNGKCYLFGEDIEPYKRSMHMAIVFNEFDDLAEQVLQTKRFADGYTINQRRLYLRQKIEWYRKTKLPEFLVPFLSESQKKEFYRINGSIQLQLLQQLERLQQLHQLQRLERLERLEQLERLHQLQRLEQLEQLEQLQRLELSAKSYDEVEIYEGSVVYCDIPYRGTAEYDGSFNHKKFYDWADQLNEPVFISEYTLPDNRFKQLWSIKKRSMLSGNGDKCSYKLEKVFGNKAAVRALFQYNLNHAVQ